MPAGFAVNPNVAVVLPMMCHGDEATAIDRGIDGAHFFGFSLAYYYAFGEHRPGRSNLWREFNERRDEVGFAREIVTPDDAPLGVRLLQEGSGSLRGAIGTPDQIADLIERYEAAGVDQVIFVSQAGDEPPRAHLREPRAVRRRGHAALRRARRRARAREGRAARRRAASGRWRAVPPPASLDPAYVVRPDGEPAPADAERPRRRARDGRPSAPSAASWPRGPARRPSREWFAAAATRSYTASSTAGPGWR